MVNEKTYIKAEPWFCILTGANYIAGMAEVSLYNYENDFPDSAHRKRVIAEIDRSLRLMKGAVHKLKKQLEAEKQFKEE